MKSLVIYFSHTGENYTDEGIKNLDKGNTEVIAKYISSKSGADLYKVERVRKYPFNYKACCDEAKVELDSNCRPEIVNTLKEVKDNEIIYIGGPIWWGHYPLPLFTQLEKLDFKGEIIKPFATHEGSGLGESSLDLISLCQGAYIKNGLAIRGSDVHKEDTKAKIDTWMDK